MQWACSKSFEKLSHSNFRVRPYKQLFYERFERQIILWHLKRHLGVVYLAIRKRQSIASGFDLRLAALCLKPASHNQPALIYGFPSCSIAH